MYSFGLGFRYVFGSDGMRRNLYRWIVQDRETGETVWSYHHEKNCLAQHEAEYICKRLNGISCPERKANPNRGYTWYQEYSTPINRIPLLPKE